MSSKSVDVLINVRILLLDYYYMLHEVFSFLCPEKGSPNCFWVISCIVRIVYKINLERHVILLSYNLTRLVYQLSDN